MGMQVGTSRALADRVPAGTRTLAEAVQARLAGDILAGRLSPGARLKLVAIAAAYGSGMSPLREALAGLVGQGLVLQEGQRGFRVAPASAEDLADIVRVRAELEVSALRASIGAGTAAWEAGILSSFHMLKRHRRTQDQLIDEPWEALHRAYHVSLIAACGSPRMIAYCRSLHDQFDRYRRIAVAVRGRHARLTPRDEAIVDATLARDAAGAAALVRDHIEESGARVAEMLQGHPLAPAAR